MIKYESYIEDFNDLENLCWGQALQVLQEISDHDKEEELMAHLKECFGELNCTLTTINDYISFEWSVIYEHLGIEDEVDDYE